MYLLHEFIVYKSWKITICLQYWDRSETLGRYFEKEKKTYSNLFLNGRVSMKKKEKYFYVGVYGVSSAFLL